jgi:hypothetical protein
LGSIGIEFALERKFAAITPSLDDEFDDGWLDAYWNRQKTKTWENLEAEYRVVLLADAGAGKTYETLNRAKIAVEKGRNAFFIRIEDLSVNFELISD